MTDKMKIAKHHILMAILSYARDTNDEIVNMLNAGVMSIEEFIDEIVMELIRYAYDKNMLKKSMRSHMIDAGMKDDDSMRMAYSRMMEYVQKYRSREAEVYDSVLGTYPEALNPVPMEEVKEKLAGYQITKMNFFEMTKLQDLGILKSMVEHRLDNSKKVDNTRFMELFSEFEEFVDKLQLTDQMNDEDVVFNSVAYWVLEWKYPFELFYRMALHMEENDYKKVDCHQIVRLAGFCRIQRLTGVGASNSRFIKRRNNMVAKVVYDDANKTMDNEFNTYTLEEYLYLKAIIVETYCADVKKGILLKEWFASQTTIVDWADFLKEYNIFAIRQKKDWSNKHIRFVRNLIKSSTI